MVSRVTIHLTRQPRRSLSVFPLGVVVLLFAAGAGCSRLALDDPGGSNGGGPPSPTPALLAHPVISLVSAVGAPSRAQLIWRSHAEPADLPHFALFVGTDPVSVYSQAPTLVDPPGASAILEGLTGSSIFHVGLAVRATASDSWTPSGPILRLHTGPPIYVDPAAPPGGDGTSPATATNDLPLAILTAFLVNGGGNVWVKGGVVGPLALPLYGGVYLSGGFDAGMQLEQRDPSLHATVLEGAVNVPIVQIQAGDGPAVLDGIVLDGRLEASAGVDDPGVAAELRSLVIRDCRRGIDLRAPPAGASVRVLVTGVVVREATVEGLRLDGPHHLWIESSNFRDCNNEGVALNDLIAPESGSASFVARATNFARNGEEGIDCHLALPPGAGPGGGRFRVTIQDCDFQENALSGMVLDVDTEVLPAWTSSIDIRGCTARSNGSAGMRLDLDSTSTAFVHRVTSSANAAEGIHVSSESWPGMATISCSSILGNGGAGVASTFGQVGILLSHCVLSGNRGGGTSSDLAPVFAASSVAYLQPSAWPAGDAIASPVQDSPSPQPFARAAREYAEVIGASGVVLQLSDAPLFPVDGPVEIGDDGLARVVTSLSGQRIALDPAAVPLWLPTTAGLFDPGVGVVEDFRLAPGSIAASGGLAPPGGAPVDAGIFGSPSGGIPGRERSVPDLMFRLASTSPAWTQPLSASSDLLLAFLDGNPDPATAPSGIFAVDAGGNLLGATVAVEGNLVRVSPPPSGWKPGDVVELFPALRSTIGSSLAVPLALPLRAP
ncbi:MAG: right-handed parallel beta-helix repeat-containing protein [Planctomycetota bacterium]